MASADSTWDESLSDLRARLVRRARRLGVDSETAEDLAQEALVEGWRLRDRLYDPTGFERWLFAILGNIHQRWLRRRGKERLHLGLDATAGDPPSIPGGLVHDGFDIEVELERRELADLLDRALALLPQQMREILVHRFVDGTPVGEVATRLGLSQGAVQMRVQRGKLALRRILTTDYAEDAVALGLIDASEAGWQETRIWCPGCGARRWQGRFRGPHREVEFRCLCCEAWYVRDTTYHGVSGFRATMKKISASTFEFWRDDIRSLDPHADPHGHRAGLRRYLYTNGEHQLVGGCTRCGWEPATTIESLALFTPQGQRFWRDHPRIRRIVNRELEVDGVPAVLTSYESVAGRNRLDVVLTRDDFRVVRIERS